MLFFFQAEDGIRDSSTSRGLGDVYKRQHINSMGAESLETYNPAIHVEDLNVRWKAGTRFLSLLKDSVFNLVPTRKAAKLVVKALKAGKNTVDLTGEASGPDDKTEENA